MALVDEITLQLKAGKGGDGVVRWIHEKFKEFGGPGGGDGGRGGSVYARGVKDSWLLVHYRHATEFSAEDGEQGGNHHMKGADGQDFILDLPVGSIITNKQTGDSYRIDAPDQLILLLKGGNGGLGNDRFKGSTNQRPTQSTPGKPGEEAEFFIEVELIADAGLIGLPNAGKSSLLNTLTRAGAKVGHYAFTTLEPNLGDLYGNILADIPGLIEGAALGKGLGHTFLRHIKRTEVLLHCISCEHFISDSSGKEFQDTYDVIRKELEAYDISLAQKQELLIVTKTDMCTADQLSELKIWLGSHPVFSQYQKENKIYYVNILDDDLVKDFRDNLTAYLKKVTTRSTQSVEVGQQ